MREECSNRNISFRQEALSLLPPSDTLTIGSKCLLLNRLRHARHPLHIWLAQAAVNLCQWSARHPVDFDSMQFSVRHASLCPQANPPRAHPVGLIRRANACPQASSTHESQCEQKTYAGTEFIFNGHGYDSITRSISVFDILFSSCVNMAVFMITW